MVAARSDGNLGPSPGLRPLVYKERGNIDFKVKNILRDLINNKPAIGQRIGDDIVGTGGAAVFGDVKGAADAAGFADAAHEKDGVGVAENVSLADRLGDQVVKHDVRGRVKIQAADRVRIVRMGPDLGFMGAKMFAEDFAGGPIVRLAYDMVIQVFEKLELDRFGETLGRLDAVNDDATDAADELGVEIGRGVAEDASEVGFPGVPVVGFEVSASDATAGAGERVVILAERLIAVPDRLKRDRRGDGMFDKFPIELFTGIGGVVLGVASTGEVAHNPATLLDCAGRRRANGDPVESCPRRSRRR